MRSILIVDDDDAQRELIVRGLRHTAFAVHEASNGKEAIDIATRVLPDLIITDLMMDKLDGFSLIERFRKDISTATIPVIVISGMRPEEGYRRSMELGADDYLAKPFEIRQLLAAIEARFQRLDSELSVRNEKLAQLRDKISRSLPHEFRTPLAIVTMAAEFLESNPVVTADEGACLAVESLRTGIDRLKRVTEQFVLFSRVEMWHHDQRMKEYFRNESCDVDLALLTAIAHGQATKSERSPEECRITIEPAALRMREEHARIVIAELLDNAFRYSKPGTEVSVDGTRRGSFFVLKIEDQGRGMSKSEVKDVNGFMQFRREHFEQQGIGLGLTTAKRLIELYDGILTIDSAIDAGTRVEVRLPLANRSQ